MKHTIRITKAAANPFSEERAEIDGHPYHRWNGGFWDHPDGDKADNTDRVICECGNDTFLIRRTDYYETSGQCTECGKVDVVHDG